MTSTIVADTSESRPEKLVDIKDRSFAFVVRIVKLCRFLEKNSTVSRNLMNQLLDAGTSVGANLEEQLPGKAKPTSFIRTPSR